MCDVVFCAMKGGGCHVCNVFEKVMFIGTKRPRRSVLRDMWKGKALYEVRNGFKSLRRKYGNLIGTVNGELQ